MVIVQAIVLVRLERRAHKSGRASVLDPSVGERASLRR
jgi:hypothetical protein